VSRCCAAAAAGLAPVKVNAVLIRGVNDHETAALLRFCLDRGYQLRFIEQMPLDAQHGWRRADMVTAGEILAALSAEFTLTPEDPGRLVPHPPSDSWSTAAPRMSA
jgi:cyclic pyranopterin phosphate synthase